MAKNFSNLGKETYQIQESQIIPKKINLKIPTLRHIIIKLSEVKDKERTLRAARENQPIMYKGSLQEYQWVKGCL